MMNILSRMSRVFSNEVEEAEFFSSLKFLSVPKLSRFSPVRDNLQY